MTLALTVTLEVEDEKYLDGEGFWMTDDLRDKVAQFCRDNGIPDSDTFVCIAVHDANSSPPCYLSGYGDIELRLKANVIDELSVVCNGDFQDVAVNGADRPAGPKQKLYVTKFWDLTPLSPAKKRLKLEKLVRNSAGLYVEARLFRPITQDDVARRTDHSLLGNLERRDE